MCALGGIGGIGGIGCLALVAFAAAGLRYNASGSLPRGLYLLRPLPASGAAARANGSGAPIPSARRWGAPLVLFCPPPQAAALALARGYLRPGSCPGGTRPLGKLLLAGSGDRLDLSARGLAVNGRPLPLSAPRRADPAGRPLRPFPFGRLRLAPGQVWVYAPHPRSFDSRYFGPLEARNLRGLLVPVWTGVRLPPVPPAAAPNRAD
jgi:conjugative transfer signal peptidase TraF